MYPSLADRKRKGDEAHCGRTRAHHPALCSLEPPVARGATRPSAVADAKALVASRLAYLRLE